VKAGDVPGSFPVLRLITRLNIGGPARQALILTRELARSYPTVLAAGRPSAQEGELHDPDVAVVKVPLVRPLRPASDVGAVVAVRRLLQLHETRLVHTHTAKAGAVGRLAAMSLKGRRPRTVHTFHGHVLDGYFHPLVQRSFIEAERRLARHTDVLIAVSPQIRDSLLALGIGTPQQFVVVPLGLDLGPFAAARATAGAGRLRQLLGLGADTPLVGAVGRLAPIKDLGTLLAAVARLPGVHVALLGDGECRRALEGRADELGLSGRAHFLGWYDDVPGAMADFDVVALTSLNEGTPVAVIEALAAATPVVATDVGGVGFVVRDGATGLLAPKSDPPSFSEQLLRVFEDRQWARAMALTGQRDVTERFGYPRLVADVGDLYRNLIGAWVRA
jgi:glycosyltransferase involved in cell wall biosynthesis